MVSASLLPSPGSSHGMRSLASFSPHFLCPRSVFPEEIQSCDPQTGEAGGQPPAATAPPHRGMVLTLCLSDCDSLLHPTKHSSSSFFYLLSTSSTAPVVKRASVEPSRFSLMPRQRAETPALPFRFQALLLVDGVSWPLASPPLPPIPLPLPSSLSISLPPSCCSRAEPL